MSKTKVKVYLPKESMDEFRNSDEVAELILNKSQEIARRCGSGYMAELKDRPTRCMGVVTAETWRAKRDNLKNNTLLKALK